MAVHVTRGITRNNICTKRVSATVLGASGIPKGTIAKTRKEEKYIGKRVTVASSVPSKLRLMKDNVTCQPVARQRDAKRVTEKTNA
jgi:hypothetical protein